MDSHAHDLDGAGWPFSDPENTAAICCVHVLNRSRPILRVTHDEDDGMWQILCGSAGHEAPDGHVVCLGCMVARDPAILELANLPLGWCAERTSVGMEWTREPNLHEVDDDASGDV
jgi:hypothetical protein